MYPLDAVYGPSAYKRFLREGKEFVSFKSELKPSSDQWRDEPLEAGSFDKLIEIVSFFSVMNKRSSLFFRGQGRHLEMIPCIFRPEWTSIGKIRHKIPNNSAVRQKIWDHLNSVIAPLIMRTLQEFALPRRRSIEMFREAAWAVAQHYDVWPTPLIDVTTNLRIAASFALSAGRAEGQLYIVSLVPSTNSNTFDADQHIVLARLQAVCPPVARRPHYQDGYLAGRFPFAGPNSNQIDRDPEKASRLSRRLVARIKLVDARDGITNEPSSDLGGFWSSDFPRVSETALMPSEANDEVFHRLKEHAGQIDAAMAGICRGL
jgi:hypothetical protein